MEKATFKTWTKVIFHLFAYKTNATISIIKFEVTFFCLLQQWRFYHKNANHSGNNKDISVVLYKNYGTVYGLYGNKGYLLIHNSLYEIMEVYFE